MARRDANKAEIRRVVAKIPAALYVRLYSTKLYTGRTLEALMPEGITLVIARYRLERDANRADGDDEGESAP